MLTSELDSTTFGDHAKNRSLLGGAFERNFDPMGDLILPIFKISNVLRVARGEC